jgi:hypothetical protein
VSSEQSNKLFEIWRESAEKFDYFVTGVTVAVVAYLGQNLRPERLGMNGHTLEIGATATLVASAAMGFKRIEGAVHFNRVHAQWMQALESKTENVQAAAKSSLSLTGSGVVTSQQLMQRAKQWDEAATMLDPVLKEIRDRVTFYYRWRNGLLLAGFALLIVARTLPAYF